MSSENKYKVTLELTDAEIQQLEIALWHSIYFFEFSLTSFFDVHGYQLRNYNEHLDFVKKVLAQFRSQGHGGLLDNRDEFMLHKKRFSNFLDRLLRENDINLHLNLGGKNARR